MQRQDHGYNQNLTSLYADRASQFQESGKNTRISGKKYCFERHPTPFHHQPSATKGFTRSLL
jgi:hypothetical protein